MSNAGYASNHDTTVHAILDMSMDTVVALDTLMQYFRMAGRHAIIYELSEWVFMDDACEIVDLEEVDV